MASKAQKLATRKALASLVQEEPLVVVEKGLPGKVAIPPHAVSVWTDGAQLFVCCPSSEEKGERTTTLKIDLSRCSVETSGFGKPLARQTGWLVFINLLKDRFRANLADLPRLGMKTRPIQYEIEEIMRHLTRFDAKGKEVVEVSAEELGI